MIPTRKALIAHLQEDHNPPISPAFVSPCIEAIAAMLVGQESRLVSLPSGKHVTAASLVYAFHLDAFMVEEEEEEDE